MKIWLRKLRYKWYEWHPVDGIKNLIKWFPIIWTDRWWDHSFIFKMLHFKLNDMEKLYRARSIHKYSDETADQMKMCVRLLDRIIKDDYITNALQFHEKKYGEIDFKFTPIEGTDCSSLDLVHKKELTEAEAKMANKLRNNLYKHSDNMETQDVEMLFKLMTKYIRMWWD